MKKKLVAMVMAAAFAGGALTGCGSSTGADSGSSAASSVAAAESTQAAEGESTETAADGAAVTLNVMCGYAGEEPHGQYVYQYAKDYMAEHPEVTINIEAVSTNDIYTKLSAMATTPEDLPQIFFTSADPVATLNDLGLTADLTDLLTEDQKSVFANGVLDSCMLDGKIRFFPIAVQPQAIIYRIDRFEEAGLSVPTTWDDFVKAAAALTKDTDGDGQNDQWGFDMVGSNNSSGQSRFMSYLWANGVDCVTEEDGSYTTDLTADNEMLVEAFTRWTGMNTDGVVPTGITEVDYPTAANYFAMGYTSMFMTGSNALGVAYSNNPDLKGKLGSFKLPGDYPGTMLGTEGYAVSSYATEAEQKAAVDFLMYFDTHDTSMQFWQSSGKIPTTIEGQKAEYITGADYAGYLQQIADGCRPTITFPGISGLKSSLGDAYSSVFSGEKTNEEALQQLASDTEELLADYN